MPEAVGFQLAITILEVLHLHLLCFLSNNDTLVKAAARIIQRTQFEASKT
jgi:hypothetical protein